MFFSLDKIKEEDGMKSIDYLLKAYGVAKESKKDEHIFFFFISIVLSLMYNVPTKEYNYFSYNAFTK